MSRMVSQKKSLWICATNEMRNWASRGFYTNHSRLIFEEGGFKHLRSQGIECSAYL